MREWEVTVECLQFFLLAILAVRVYRMEKAWDSWTGWVNGDKK